MIVDAYYNSLISLLHTIKTTQREAMRQAARIAADVIEQDGIIYLFGCGHSHLIALDCFYRAGGLANVSAMLDTDLMLHNGAAKSSKMEKMSGIAESVFERYCLTDRDLLITISTSGKNAVPCEMSTVASTHGVPNIAIVSGAYFNDPGTRPKLYETCDLYIDNCVPHGDAVVPITDSEANMGSVSTIASSFIVQSILLEAAEIAAQRGVTPKIYKSGNVEGGAVYNRALIEEFLPRIKHL